MFGATLEPMPLVSPRRCAVTRSALLLVALLGGAAGCGAPETAATLTLGWRLVDGRSCADAAVERVHVWSLEPPRSTPLATLPCPAGKDRPALTLELPGGRATLRLEGRSAADTVLYRRTVVFDLEGPGPHQRLVELVYTGGL